MNLNKIFKRQEKEKEKDLQNRAKQFVEEYKVIQEATRGF